MKRIFKACSLLLLVSAGSAFAATQTYILTLTNGSQMPVSPVAVYVTHGQASKSEIASSTTNGFILLCQTGNPALRLQELEMEKDVTFKSQTMGLLFPGETKTIEVEVQDPLHQSIHFEAMYGKTKDVCAVGTIGSHQLIALRQHVTSSYQTKDNVVQTGAFLDPSLPAGATYLDSNACESETSAIGCLRKLALPNPESPKIRFFSSYLSSLQMFLETKYGAKETQSLIVPSSGAVAVQLSLKH